jgi:hypothetical protein
MKAFEEKKIYTPYMRVGKHTQTGFKIYSVTSKTQKNKCTNIIRHQT